LHIAQLTLPAELVGEHKPSAASRRSSSSAARAAGVSSIVAALPLGGPSDEG
jgi:hypothetical protein